MTAQTAYGTVHFSFHHEQWDEPIAMEVTRYHYAKAATYCNLTASWIPGLVFSAPAFCSVSDHFDRERGRKVALKRVVDLFPAGVRKAVWEAYLHRPRTAGTLKTPHVVE